ncbi:cytochrome P450 4c21-like [Ochlerotatus camptorhynchus]|uniref:cytochrome P450 4c21-like n=1 Tax=Ochlerotatus camptorhynchus TaxID=644619 RepID=UPI0031D1BEE4
MCRDKEGGILTDEREVIERWKQHYDEHLNGAEAEDQGSRMNDIVATADEGNMTVPTIDEVKDAIRQLKNNKAAASLWRSQRKALNATFAPSVLNSFIPRFERFAKLLVQDLSESAGCTVNLLRFSSACTFNMICHTTMGIEESDKEEIETFVSNMDQLTEIVGRRFLSVHLHSERVYRMTATYHREMEFRRKCNNYAMKILNEKMQNKDNNRTRKVFIEQLLDGSTLGRTFTTTEIVQNVYGMLAAGSETTALTIAHACLFLAMFPDIQEKVFGEIFTLWPDSDQPLTAATLSDLVYMEAFLKEVLRLCPVAPIIARESSAPVELDGVNFPKGTIFILNFLTLHRRSEIWGSDGDCFDPERFLTGNVENRHPFGFLPFSGGQRNCIGQRYAMMSLKVMVVQLLRSFRISTQLRYEDLRFQFGLLLELSSEYLVQFDKRSVDPFQNETGKIFKEKDLLC